MKMVSLKRTAAEREEGLATAGPMPYEGPEYPYGTQLDLSGEVLKRLGIDLADVSIDQEFTITAKCCVSRTSSSNSADGDAHQSMTLQIKEISLESEERSIGKDVKKILARRFYGGENSEYE